MLLPFALRELHFQLFSVPRESEAAQGKSELSQ
jgi:hypothetical protein